MDTTRIREELGWQEHSAADALQELLEGLRDGAGARVGRAGQEHAGGDLRHDLCLVAARGR